ncbi:RNA polymerase sigma factor [Rhodocaloribacter sp.]
MDRDDVRTALKRHHRESFGWALACCAQDPDAAADVLQTAYLKVLEGRARFDGRSAFRTWLFAVIRNTAADARRRQRLRRLGLIRYAEGISRPAHAPAEDERLDRARMQADFRAMLARLPRRQREALHLVFYHDLTIREAAVVMGVSLGSARTHYERGKKRLRQWLTTDDDETGRRSAETTLSRTETGG